jgi:hypothetical protein
MWIGRPTIDGVTGPGPTAHWLGRAERWIRTHGWASAALLVITLAPDGRVVHPVPGGPTRIPAPFLPSSLVFLVLLYSVAARADTARSRAALVIALAGAGIMTGTTAAALRRFANGSWLVVFYVGVGLAIIVVLSWNLGRFALMRRQRVVTERAVREELVMEILIAGGGYIGAGPRRWPSCRSSPAIGGI